MKYLSIFLLIFCTGCATLPGTVPLSEQEEKDALKIFKKILFKQKNCPESVDADVSVSVQKILASGTMSGYLQAKAPSLFRFEGVNPLGMTETVLTTDGDEFTFLNIRQQKGYLGKLNSQKIKSYAPGSFAASKSFYWLIGRFPPGQVEILKVERDQKGGGYWVEVVYENEKQRSMILFAGQDALIYQNLSLSEEGEVLARFLYEYQSDLDAQSEINTKFDQKCPLPTRVTIDGNSNGVVTINFKRNYPNAKFSRSNFLMNIPKSFEKEIVQ